jgi:indolepyruvate ferredoxin oxidoreductase beta subunit
MKNKKFNLLIVGTGGQGLITLLEVVAEAAKIEGYDIRTSELHGLSQRGGSVEVHIRFGKKVYTPLVPQGGADMILGLESQEVLKAVPFGDDDTEVLVNELIVNMANQNNLTVQQVKNRLKKHFSNLYFMPATELCSKELGKPVVAGMFLISLASFKGILPLKPESIKASIKKTIPSKYQELNMKAFNLAKESLNSFDFSS